MFKRMLLAAAIVALTISLTACVVELEELGGMVSGAVKEYTESVELSDSHKSDEPIEVDLDLKAAKAIFSSTSEKLVDARFLYGSKALKPELVIRDDEIIINSAEIRSGLKKSMNQWEVKLTDQIPLEMKLEADIADIRLNLSEMLMRELDMSLDASTAKIYFDKQNKETIKRLKLYANASSVNIYGGGNSNFEKLDMEANASKINADLTGEYKQDSEVVIDASASTVRLRLPQNIGVRIVLDKYELSTVNIKNGNILSRSDKEYVTKNYKEAECKLEIYVDLNVTTLTIE